jgi:hypothetical protein
MRMSCVTCARRERCRASGAGGGSAGGGRSRAAEGSSLNVPAKGARRATEFLGLFKERCCQAISTAAVPGTCGWLRARAQASAHNAAAARWPTCGEHLERAVDVPRVGVAARGHARKGLGAQQPRGRAGVTPPAAPARGSRARHRAAVQLRPLRAICQVGPPNGRQASTSRESPALCVPALPSQAPPLLLRMHACNRMKHPIHECGPPTRPWPNQAPQAQPRLVWILRLRCRTCCRIWPTISVMARTWLAATSSTRS